MIQVGLPAAVKYNSIELLSVYKKLVRSLTIIHLSAMCDKKDGIRSTFIS